MKHIIIVFLFVFLSCGRSNKPIYIEKINLEETLITIKVNSPYLLIPMEDKGKEITVDFQGEGKKINQYVMRLAVSKIDYWMPMDISKYKEIKLSVSNISDTALVFKHIKQSDTVIYNYNETYRPLYHFSPPLGWMNDPNGMVFYNGEYHLCYQSNPYGSKWQNMSWGHAISANLVEWINQPVALFPDSLGTIFSGSTVVDWNNSSGLQQGDEKTLLAFYTNFLPEQQYQSLAYSNDKGRTWNKYYKNPILKHAIAKDFRDPKVFWHESSNKWIMILAVGQMMEIYSSGNALNWIKESEFGLEMGSHAGVWECPDLFELPIEGSNESKWILICNINPGGPQGGSATQYFIGSFDGKCFVNDNPAKQTLWMDWGKDHYAAVTWADMDHKSITRPRRVAIAWMSNWEYANDVPTVNFRNAMTLPRQLSLAKVNGKLILKSVPVEELKLLRKNEVKSSSFTVKNIDAIQDISTNTGAFELEFELGSIRSEFLKFKLQNSKGDFVEFILNMSQQTITVDRIKSGLVNFSPAFPAKITTNFAQADSHKFRIFVDKASIELFLNDGEIALTTLVFPTEPYNQILFNTKEGSFQVHNFTTYQLKSSVENI